MSARIGRLEVEAFAIPTDAPESDGTAEWDSTTIVVVHAHGGGRAGLGYTYCDAAAAAVVSDLLARAVEGADAMDVRAAWLTLGAQLRNSGRPGIGFCALSAVDQALWDLKARLLDVPLVVLLGAAHDGVPIYGSGGFCSYSDERLREQLGGWAADGVPRVKMKVGREPERDPARLDAAREAIGADVELFVDANGAFAAKQALAWAERYALEWGVSWFEEPVSSADLAGLRLLRERGPAGLDVDAGRADAAADRGRGRGRLLREGGAHVAAGAVGAVRPRRPRRRGHTPAGRPEAAGRPRRADVQPRHGPAALAPGSLCLVGAMGLLAAVVKRER